MLAAVVGGATAWAAIILAAEVLHRLAIAW